jgi:transcriptional regulator with XRE-family HTH domain
MGEVVGFGRRRPNGLKIVELRKGNGLKQEVLAQQTGISVRLLRDVERRNHPLDTATLTALATELKVTADDIILVEGSLPETVRTTPEYSPFRLKLKVVLSATVLSSMADRSSSYAWTLNVDPSTETASEMQQVMLIVRRMVDGCHSFADHDEFDGMAFDQIPRLARLKEVLETLRDRGVNVLAGTHVYRWRDEGGVLTLKTILTLSFVNKEIEEESTFIDPGLPDSDVRDDDIPF